MQYITSKILYLFTYLLCSVVYDALKCIGLFQSGSRSVLLPAYPICNAFQVYTQRTHSISPLNVLCIIQYIGLFNVHAFKCALFAV